MIWSPGHGDTAVTVPLFDHFMKRNMQGEERLEHGGNMAFEMLVGLQENDEAGYARYRDAMAPILARFGGGFRYDFRVAEVLRQETEAPINRVFTIHFADRASSDSFFADPAYLAVRDEHFAGSVGATTILAAYER